MILFLYVSKGSRDNRLSCHYTTNGQLIFRLNATPPPHWIQQFRSLREYSSIFGKGPADFRFAGDTMPIPAEEERDVGQVARNARNYVQQTNEQYRVFVTQQHQAVLAARREELRRQVEEE